MTHLASFPLEAGGNVLIEVEQMAAAPITRGLHSGDAIEAISHSFEAALDAVRPAVASLASKFRSLLDAPCDLEVEFGLKFSGQAGAFIASASTEAQFRVKMVWKGRPATAKS
jgi:hypothetical protein